MKRLLGVLVFLLVCAPLVGATALNDYGNYTTFYHNITVGMGAQTNYQVKFILSNASGISGYYAPVNIIYTNGTTRADWFDVNATDGSGTPLPFWIENNTYTAYNATAWVNVPTIAVDNTSTGRWYFGNSTQSSSTMDGLNTFPLWDDFIDGSLNTTKWIQETTGTGTVAVSGTTATLTAGASTTNIAMIQSMALYGVNYSTRSRYKNDVYTETGAVGFGSGSNPSARLGSDTTSNQYIASSITTSEEMTNLGTSYTGYHVWEITKLGGASLSNKFYIDDTLKDTDTTRVSSTATNVTALAYSSSNKIYQDWAFVRKAVPTPPTTSAYTTVSATVVPVAAFSCTPTSVELGSPTTCTDASSGSPSDWYWEFGDGNTSTTQNPSYTYPFIGTFNVNLKANNSAGSDWENKTNYITVTNLTGLVQQDIWMQGQFLQTFHITDSSTNLPIANVTLTSSSGHSYTTTNGTGYLTEGFGAATVTFVSSGYTSRIISYVFDEDATHTVQLTPTSTSTQTDVDIQGTPKQVQFHVQSFWGQEIQGATVSVQGISTTTGSWDWIVTALGLPLDEVPINSTAMNGTTDSLGNIEFLMIPTAKYNVTTTASGYTFPTFYITPHDTQYTIIANMNGTGWFASGNDTLKETNVSVSWVTFNSTHAFVNISYLDQTATTTGGTITVYQELAGQKANKTPVASMAITGSNCTNSTLVTTPTGGASYTAIVNATTSTGENVVRTFTHYFKGSPVMLPGWTSETLLWLALFIIIFTAGFAGALHSPQMAVILCVESWVFWGIGWLDALITQFWYAEGAVVGVLILASFITIWWNVAEGKAKGKRSS